MANHIERLRRDIYRELVFWSGWNSGRATALGQYDSEYDRAMMMHDEIFELEPSDFQMLRFYLNHVIVNFLPGAGKRELWAYLYRKARQAMRESDIYRDIPSKLIWLCCYPH